MVEGEIQPPSQELLPLLNISRCAELPLNARGWNLGYLLDSKDAEIRMGRSDREGVKSRVAGNCVLFLDQYRSPGVCDTESFDRCKYPYSVTASFYQFPNTWIELPTSVLSVQTWRGLDPELTVNQCNTPLIYKKVKGKLIWVVTGIKATNQTQKEAVIPFQIWPAITINPSNLQEVTFSEIDTRL